MLLFTITYTFTPPFQMMLSCGIWEGVVCHRTRHVDAARVPLDKLVTSTVILTSVTHSINP